jgi:hypothetical protein
MKQGNPTKFTQAIVTLLHQSERPSLQTHVNNMDPTEWSNISARLVNKDTMLGLAFCSVPQFLLKLEDNTEDCHLASIWGHSSVHKLFPFYPSDISVLQSHHINTVSQIFDMYLSRGIEKTISSTLMNNLQAFSYSYIKSNLCPKLPTETLSKQICQPNI